MNKRYTDKKKNHIAKAIKAEENIHSVKFNEVQQAIYG